jgi:hypothetical protein
MNIFRSEEHVRNWDRYDPESHEGIIALPDLMKLFSGEMFQKRLEPDYFSRRGEYRNEFVAVLTEMGKEKPFWSPTTP